MKGIEDRNRGSLLLLFHPTLGTSNLPDEAAFVMHHPYFSFPAWSQLGFDDINHDTPRRSVCHLPVNRHILLQPLNKFHRNNACLLRDRSFIFSLSYPELKTLFLRSGHRALSFSFVRRPSVVPWPAVPRRVDCVAQ